MHNFSRARLAEVADISLGKMLNKETNSGELLPYLANFNVQWGRFDLSELNYTRFEEYELDRFALKRGDIVMCEGGEPGRCAIWNEELPNIKYQKALHRLRTFAGYDSNFLYYRFLLAGRTNEFERYFIGSTIKHLTGVTLKEIEFDFPDYPEQKRIAAVLSALDAKIELNNRINHELEALARTTYDYWFLQFDFPDSTGRPYRTAGGKMIYNESLRRYLPDGWQVKQIRDLTKCNYRSVTQKDRFEFINYLDTANLTQNSIGQIELIDLASEPRPQRAQRIVQKNDILYSTVRPNQYHFGIVREPAPNMIASSGFVQLSSSENTVSNELLYLSITSSSNTHRLTQIAELAVSSYPSISPDDLLDLKILLPKDHGLLQSFNEIANGIFNQLWNNKEQNQRLASIRDWLLPMLMNGQVTIRKERAPIQETTTDTESTQIYYKIQILFAIIWANQRRNVKQAEVGICKDAYLLDRVFGIRTGFNFTRHNWGSFDPQEKMLLNTKKYFKKQTYPNSQAYYIDIIGQDYLLPRIADHLKDDVESAINDMHDNLFGSFSGAEKTRQKELYSTVLKCIEDSQSLALETIREELNRWKIMQNGSALTKAEKFSESETKAALEFIVKNNWHDRILNRFSVRANN